MYKNIIQVIIPVYNAEKTLSKCLDSLLSQSFSDWNALLVDDCSGDSSLKIIEEYVSRDSRFDCIRMPKNGGASAAKNSALKVATGEYIAFLDSDDYWEPQMLEAMYEKVKETSADVVQCRFIYDFPDGSRYLPGGAFEKDITLEGKELKKVYIRMMTGINMNHACMKLIKRDCMEEILFDESLPTAEDLDFCVRVFKNVKKYSFINIPMYHYCRWENSLTGRGLAFSVKLRCNKAVSKTMASELPLWGIDTLPYRFLTYMRPYVIIVSKIFRMLREKSRRSKEEIV